MVFKKIFTYVEIQTKLIVFIYLYFYPKHFFSRILVKEPKRKNKRSHL